MLWQEKLKCHDYLVKKKKKRKVHRPALLGCGMGMGQTRAIVCRVPWFSGNLGSCLAYSSILIQKNSTSWCIIG